MRGGSSKACPSLCISSFQPQDQMPLRSDLHPLPLSRLTSAGFSQLGLDYVCLWYSDETALAVYRKLGFRSVARFT